MTLTLLLRQEDIVLKQAKESILNSTPSECALTLYAAMKVLQNQAEISIADAANDMFLRDVYTGLPYFDRAIESKERAHSGFESVEPTADFTDRMAQDLEFLASSVVGTQNEANKYRIVAKELGPLQALLLDGIVRYGYLQSDALHYVFGLLEVNVRYGIEFSAA